MNNRKLAVVNSIAGLLSQLLLIFFQFVQRKLFLNYLGVEILGISGAVSSLTTALSLVDAGIGPAITYNLYKPISENDTEQINKLMNIYRVLYQWVAGAVILFALFICPFLPRLLSGIEYYHQIYVYYFLFVAESVSGYFLSYRRCLFVADRRDYICKIVDFSCNLIFLFIRITIIVRTQNYILFLIANLALTLISNLIIYWLCKRRYLFLTVEKYDIILLKKLWPQMRELFSGKIAAFFYSSSDNIVISKFVSTVSVGFLSNYTMVTVHLKNIIFSIFGFCGTMLGTVIANTEQHNKKRGEYFELYSFGLYIAVIVLIVPEAVLLNYFVENVWGSQYLMSNSIVTLLILDQYITIVQDSCGVYMAVDGYFAGCKWADGVAALLNIIISIGLVFEYQIFGVLVGTVISRLAQWMIKAYYVNIVSLDIGVIGLFKYWLKNVIKFIMFGITLWIVTSMIKIIQCDLFIIRFVLVGVLSVGISAFSLFLFWGWTHDGKLMFRYIGMRCWEH